MTLKDSLCAVELFCELPDDLIEEVMSWAPRTGRPGAPASAPHSSSRRSSGSARGSRAGRGLAVGGSRGLRGSRSGVDPEGAADRGGLLGHTEQPIRPQAGGKPNRAGADAPAPTPARTRHAWHRPDPAPAGQPAPGPPSSDSAVCRVNALVSGTSRGSRTLTGESLCGRRAAKSSRFASIPRPSGTRVARARRPARGAHAPATPRRGSGHGVRMLLQVQPPRRLCRSPPVHRHRDEVGAVLDVAEDDLAWSPGATAGRGQPQRPPPAWLRPPQPDAATGHAQQRAMGMPERHDEPARLQARTSRTRCIRSLCARLTIIGHVHSVASGTSRRQSARPRPRTWVREIVACGS